jgi:hypothetical protein
MFVIQKMVCPMISKPLFTVFVYLLSLNLLSAQKLSREQDILFSTTMVRTIDLDWKCNQPYFGEDRLFIQILIKGMAENSIRAYTDDGFKNQITLSGITRKVFPEDEDSLATGIEPLVNRLHVFELEEELIFDSKASVHYFRPLSIAIVLTSGANPLGINEKLCVFRFEDCVSLFRADPDANSEKRLSAGRKINYADLLVLKCFNNKIVKIGDRNDPYFDQIFSDEDDAFVAGKDAENKITEYLYKLYNPR